MVHIVAFGDSTTAERQTVKQVYAQRLPALLKEKGITAVVINSGLGGSHTGHVTDNARHKRPHALDRFQSAVRDHQPDVAILQFGINDSWVDSGGEGGAARIPLGSYTSNLTFLVRTLKADQCHVILMTPNALGQQIESWRRQRLAQYAQAARDIAEQEQVKLVDVWRLFEDFAGTPAQNTDAFLLDGVHPNDLGHLLVAQQLAAAVHSILSGKLSLAPVFTDHMVLQRDSPLPVWGNADPGESMTVQFAGQTKTAMADPTGRWLVKLDPLAASGQSRTLRVSTQSSKRQSGIRSRQLRDVVVGEVWLAAGQSNMEWPLGKATHGEEALATTQRHPIRLFKFEGAARGGSEVYTPEMIQRLEPERFCSGVWRVAAADTARDFSAAAWFFGVKLAEELSMPVGLIDVSIGGTPTEAWIRKEALAAHPRLNVLLHANWLDNPHTGEWCRERARSNLDRALKSGEAIPSDDLGPNHSFKPCFMWQSAVAPLVPFAIRGVIWYQGESNADSPERVRQHGELFPLLIRDWRLQWGQGDFSFLFAQLPGLNRPDWPAFRETQRRTLKTVPCTGMTVTIDLGHPTNVHPPNKQPVGERLALWALAQAYRRNIEFSGPLFRSIAPRGRELVVEFDYADGLATVDGKPPVGFEIAGADQEFVPATPGIVGRKLVLASPEVHAPFHARYGWTPFPDPPLNLVNDTGLPASPFSSTEP